MVFYNPGDPGQKQKNNLKRGKPMQKTQNFNFFISTIKLLAQSHGFYGRLLSDIKEREEYDPDIIENLKENLPDFKKDRLNVVFYLEQ